MKTVTGMGGIGGARELAEMLRQMGRGPDTMLAHITPEEAEMLMRMGGSGDMNPNTGLPEFQPYSDYESDAYLNAPQNQDFNVDIGFGPGEFTPPAPPRSELGGMPAEQFQRFSPYEDFTPAPAYDPGMDIGFGPGQFAPSYGAPDIRGMGPEQFGRFMDQPEPSPFARAAETVEGGFRRVDELARKYPNIANILATTGQSLPALLQASRARKEGERAAQELRALGRPLREQGEALRQQALTGGLTPQQARQQEASRARLRQAASTRGVTTGTQQAMIEGQLSRERAAMAETNLNNALKQLNLANAYDEAAIRAKLLSDRQVAESLSNVYANLARSVGGAARQQQAPARIQRASAPILPEEPVTRRPDVRG